MQTLQQLMGHIATVWQCDPSRYPELEGMNAEERQNFLIKHSVLHITKTTGKLATLSEDYDHNQKIGDDHSENLKTLATKMFVNSLKLAEEVGMSADDLLHKAPEYIK